MADILEFLPLPDQSGTAHAPASHAEHAAEMLDVRPLSVEECKALEPIFAERGVELPDPRWSTIIGCVTDGKVTNNFLVVQLRIHAEPMHLEDENLIHRIVSVAEEYIARKCGTVDVFLFAPAGRIARLAQLAGDMRVEPWVVLSKRVEGVAALDESSNLEQTQTGPESESLTEKAVVTIQ